MQRDRHALSRRLRGLEQAHQRQQDIGDQVNRFTNDIERSVEFAAGRLARLPKPQFPENLPIVEKKADIAAAILANQVVILCGETGSGKTTQLPKICLELGRGVFGLIGHTQPRRIAARSLAARIAQELQSEIGAHVGFKVRFSDQTRAESYIKVMTDGILLAETQGDRFLDAYDTIIIDEAHERSLNIDFLLGYLKNLLPRRPDLKIIVTSATIDPQRFSKHFNDAPIIEVSGRTYPVEIRYRPPVDVDEGEESERPDDADVVVAAVGEVAREGAGDVLVFFSGEREIREAAEALRKHHPPQTEIVPLYSRLSAQEQQRVFQPHSGRRIILATNVAETALTVPGIRYVIDTGMARISRYSHRSKIQRLPIEAISQASAQQRAGRCGRVGPGICVRLYSEDDFKSRPAFTEPEIQRSNLANVILQMHAARLGDIEAFPFIDPPDSRFVRDGVRLLEELEALTPAGGLSEIGRQLARLPVDPRYGRILIAAQSLGCVREALVIVSGLSIQDPRERPLAKQQQADTAHRTFQDERSDFVTLLKLWRSYDEQHRHLSRRKLRQWCLENFLSHSRMLEWRDVHSQLVMIAHELNFKENDAEGQYQSIHEALLPGLIGNVGFKTEERDYLGARGTKYSIFPGSGLFKKNPKWIMAGQLVETAKVYAHYVAAIEPEWVERAAQHLLKHHYFEPHWEKKRGEACASERVTLYGLTLVSQRKVSYGRINPVEARELLLRNGLVQGEVELRAAFYTHNQELIAEVEALEHKTRRPDILVDEETLFQFYDARVPKDVFSIRHFEAWRKDVERKTPQLLFLTKEDLMRRDAVGVGADQFPEMLVLDGLRLVLEYRFEPGHPEDGVTAIVPLAALNQLDAERCEWLVPGLLRDKVIAVIKSLPKSLRRSFVPVPDFADAVLANIKPLKDGLLQSIASELQRMTGIVVPMEAWRLDDVPMHLRMNFRVIGAKSEVLASGRDLMQLRDTLGGKVRTALAPVKQEQTTIERRSITAWDFGDLPAQVQIRQHGSEIPLYPALVDDGESVSIQLFDMELKAQLATRAGLRRLFILNAPQQVKQLRKSFASMQTVCAKLLNAVECEALREDLIQAVVDEAFLGNQPLLRTAAEFAQRLEQGRGKLTSVAHEYNTVIASVANEHHAVRQRLRELKALALSDALADIDQQLQALIFPGFLRETPLEWLQQIGRYLKAVQRRLDKLRENPERDKKLRAEIAPLWSNYAKRAEEQRARGVMDPQLLEFRWLLEELRVSLFAQELKTLMPVSVARLQKLWLAMGR